MNPTYHSYYVEDDLKETFDWSGHKAFQFTVILGGEDEILVKDHLLYLLEKGLTSL